MKSPGQIAPIPITAYSVVCNCGLGKQALYEALLNGETALKKPELFAVDFPVCVGEVKPDLLPQVSDELNAYSTRNNRLALAALDCREDRLRQAVLDAVRRYGSHRIGVVLGTSTSGIYETENAYFCIENNGSVPDDYNFSTQHAWVASGRFLMRALNLQGPCYVISTACSSSGKSIAAAQRLIGSNVCDAVLAGGVDSLCRMTLNGFNSLELLSETPCTPLDEYRSGISLGEGAGLMLLERPHEKFSDCPHLLGCGESSDAYHMTAPHPEGKGAQAAMERAIVHAGLAAADIDYINLHATGTRKNDQAEVLAVNSLFGLNVRCSGSKGLTGHTLGAAGGIEAVIALLALERNFMPGTCGMKKVDADFPTNIVSQSEVDIPLDTVMSNNYGFGGNNSSLIFGRVNAKSKQA